MTRNAGGDPYYSLIDDLLGQASVDIELPENKFRKLVIRLLLAEVTHDPRGVWDFLSQSHLVVCELACRGGTFSKDIPSLIGDMRVIHRELQRLSRGVEQERLVNDLAWKLSEVSRYFIEDEFDQAAYERDRREVIRSLRTAMSFLWQFMEASIRSLLWEGLLHRRDILPNVFDRVIAWVLDMMGSICGRSGAGQAPRT